MLPTGRGGVERGIPIRRRTPVSPPNQHGAPEKIARDVKGVSAVKNQSAVRP
jgi:hypothetical protein